LKTTKDAIAIIEKIDMYNFRKMGVKIRFTINNKEIATGVGCDCRELKIADSRV
jgi:hypothetical protein